MENYKGATVTDLIAAVLVGLMSIILFFDIGTKALRDAILPMLCLLFGAHSIISTRRTGYPEKYKKTMFISGIVLVVIAVLDALLLLVTKLAANPV